MKTICIALLAVLGLLFLRNPLYARSQPPPVPIAPPVPTTIAQIETVDQSGEVTIRNSGTRPITGLALQITVQSANYSDLVVTNLLFGATLAPGDELPVFVSPELKPTNLRDQIRIVAVIFNDGTHTGNANYRVTSTDVVKWMFDQRQAVAREWAQEADIVAGLPSDDNEAVARFLVKADAIPPAPKSTSTLLDATIESVRVGIRADAQHIHEALQSGAKTASWIRQNILGRYAQQATSAEAVAKDNGEVEE